MKKSFSSPQRPRLCSGCETIKRAGDGEGEVTKVLSRSAHNWVCTVCDYTSDWLRKWRAIRQWNHKTWTCKQKNTRNCFRHSVENSSNNGKRSEDYKGVPVKNYVLFLPFHCHRMSGETIRTFQDLKHRHNLKGQKTSSTSTQKG